MLLLEKQVPNWRIWIKKVKITAKYWPAIVPIGPNIENDKIPMLRNINIGTSTKRSDLGII